MNTSRFFRVFKYFFIRFRSEIHICRGIVRESAQTCYVFTGRIEYDTYFPKIAFQSKKVLKMSFPVCNRHETKQTSSTCRQSGIQNMFGIRQTEFQCIPIRYFRIISGIYIQTYQTGMGDQRIDPSNFEQSARCHGR